MGLASPRQGQGSRWYWLKTDHGDNPTGIYHSYFLQAGKIWQDYFYGKISLTVRDGRLNYLRAQYGMR
jgi:hypothetical protein